MTTYVEIIGVACTRCQDTRNEVYLRPFVDGAKTDVWRMPPLRECDAQAVGRSVLFNDRFRLELWEHGSRRRDNRLGFLEVTDTEASTLRAHRITTLEADYTIVYSLNPSGDKGFCFEPLSMICLDSGRPTHELHLIVNACKVVGPVNLKPGQPKILAKKSVLFNTGARVELWERHRSGCTRKGVFDIDESSARMLADQSTRQDSLWIAFRPDEISPAVTYKLRYRISRAASFRFDSLTKRLTVSCGRIQVAVEGGAIVSLRDAGTGESFTDTTPWADLETTPENGSCSNETIPENSFCSKKRDDSTNSRRRRPTVESSVTFRRLSCQRGMLTYSNLQGDDSGKGQLIVDIAVDAIADEILLRVSGFEGEEEYIPTAVDLPILGLAKSAVILGNGLRYRRTAPITITKDQTTDYDYGMRSPSVAVVEGEMSALSVWSENPEFVPDYVKLYHSADSDHLVLHAGADIVEGNQCHSPLWRIGFHRDWTEAARRWRDRFESWGGAKPLWQNDIPWVRDIHAYFAGLNTTENDYNRLADVVPPQNLLRMFWNGDRIVLFGDHTLCANIGAPTDLDIQAIQDHGWRWMLYHPYDLIFNERCTRIRLGEYLCPNGEECQLSCSDGEDCQLSCPDGAECQTSCPGGADCQLPPGYLFVPDYVGRPEDWYEHWAECRSGWGVYYLLHPGSERFQAYFVQNVANWTAAFDADGCYFDTMGMDWARSWQPTDGDLRAVVNGQSWVAGERAALERFRRDSRTCNLAVMSEYQSPWLFRYAFITWDGGSEYLRKLADWVADLYGIPADGTPCGGDPPGLPVFDLHPLRTALTGSYMWTREDRYKVDSAISYPLNDKLQGFLDWLTGSTDGGNTLQNLVERLAGITELEMYALLGTLPEIHIGDPLQPQPESAVLSQNRARLFCEEGLHNDLPPHWDAAALAYYRSRSGNWFKFVRLDSGRMAYVEELPDGTERVRLPL